MTKTPTKPPAMWNIEGSRCGNDWIKWFTHMSYKYTVAIAHYNMVETVGTAICQILEITDDRYEILLVDGGSTDGSLQQLRRLEEENGRIRLIERPDSKTLAHQRNISVEEAQGDYVFLHVDADDYWHNGITEFAWIFHQIENQMEREFLLKGRTLHLASRDFLLAHGPYREPLDRFEDIDLWYRLAADDAVLWMLHEPIRESIGYDQRHLFFPKRYREYISEFRMGFTPCSALFQRLREAKEAKRGIGVLTGHVLVYIIARIVWALRSTPSLPRPGGYDRQRDLEDIIPMGTLRELEEISGFKISPDELSPEGRRIFYEYDPIQRRPSPSQDHTEAAPT